MTNFRIPRLWGTFPRVLGHYSRDLKLFSLEEAVRKMTGHTAAVFGMIDRGVIREGAYADLVLFDPDTVRDVADYDNPQAISPGHPGNLDQRPVRLCFRRRGHRGAGRAADHPEPSLMSCN